MFIVLFLVTFLLAFAISSGVAWAGKEPIEGILHHFFPPNVTAAMSKYLRLAVVLIGVSSGARIRILEEYIAASATIKAEMTESLTQEFWVVELYRTTVTTIEGILWLLLLFSFVVFVAYWIMRKSELKQQQVSENQAKFNNSKASTD
ncbi:MAG TPA: hypothetical protein VN943_08060 [Candidatus Acidoferrum sp.]|nr:hypothetical protein [Candidatus Acidoferrum sp.]